MGQHRASKRRAVKAALSQLGIQSRPVQVVAALADWGISVTESLVRAVAFELLREAARAELQRARARVPGLAPPIRRQAKMPPRRRRRG
jgi:hypothetical protein